MFQTWGKEDTFDLRKRLLVANLGRRFRFINGKEAQSGRAATHGVGRNALAQFPRHLGEQIVASIQANPTAP